MADEVWARDEEDQHGVVLVFYTYTVNTAEEIILRNALVRY